MFALFSIAAKNTILSIALYCSIHNFTNHRAVVEYQVDDGNLVMYNTNHYKRVGTDEIYFIDDKTNKLIKLSSLDSMDLMIEELE